MKTKQLLGAALAFIALVSSCKKDDYRKLEKTNPSEVQFTSRILGTQATKANGNTWDSNDEIGVFMKQGTGLSNILAGNKKYSTNGNGNFSASGNNVINYPEAGQVDFIAYYPYSADLKGTSLGFNISEQSNPAKIDVMYSNNAKSLSKGSKTASLEFAHKLAKVELIVKAGKGVSNLTGLKTAYNNIPTLSNMDLATGTIANGTGAANVQAKVTAQQENQLVEAILIPGEYSAKEVVFSIGSDNYKWTLPANLNYESGKKYTYNITLQLGGLVAVTGNAIITDWISVTGGTHTIGKDGGTVTPPVPTGTEQTIYEENFGDIPVADRSKRYKVEEYTGFSNKAVKYSNLFTSGWVDIRRTGTMDAHVWFTLNKTTGLKIEGINTTGYKDLKLTYKLAANASGKPIENLKVRINGVELQPKGVLGGQNEFSVQTISSGIPAAAITIEFDAQSATNDKGYRVDDIKLVGTK
ncbi:fimbrillin family protein [Sphingobacterium mizutaii]|uniref:fimbrillin family protein n=1 Tax=Sphingobacterium mizutaii TaxID=1010 RepID=UPI0028A7071F|nr:fimbrillin family protein [Sphingobacterium mizutaii]